jgi:DNA-binding response OmpR family regulator
MSAVGEQRGPGGTAIANRDRRRREFVTTSGATSRTVLLVEDDQDILLAVSSYFTVKGWRVVCATSLQEAVARLQEPRIDVAILDLHLAECRDGGIRVARELAAQHRETRTILLTAFGSDETRTQAREAGIDAVIGKPVRLSDLCDLAGDLGRERPAASH